MGATTPVLHDEVKVNVRLMVPILLLASLGCATNSSVVSAGPSAEAGSPSATDSNGVLGDADGGASPGVAHRSGPVETAADSAADAEILEALAGATFDSTAPAFEDLARSGGPDGAGPVTWDIQVQPFISHYRVRYYRDFFLGEARNRFAIWLTRLPKYEDMIRHTMVANDLPSDMVYLALIESGFSNTAVSRSRAVGMWQFMKGTGRMYGLRVDYWVDERRDPFKATAAAARHLADLRDRFGSLFLAAAAYNAGAGRVSRGLRRLPTSARNPDGISDETFFQLYQTRYLVRETKDYVPKLIAAALIAKQPAKYGFVVPPGIAPLIYDSLTVPDATGLDVIARLADTSLRVIRELNPQYIRLATPPGEKAMVRVPVGRGDTTAARYVALPATKRVTYRIHVIRSGDTMGQIARRYHVSLHALRLANPGTRSRSLRIGYRLIIPTGGVPSREVRLALRRNPNRPSGSYHRVRRGESIWSISRRYGISQGDLRRWNRLEDDIIRPGQNLRVRAR